MKLKNKLYSTEDIAKGIIILSKMFREGMPTVEEAGKRILKKVRDYVEGCGDWGLDKKENLGYSRK